MTRRGAKRPVPGGGGGPQPAAAAGEKVGGAGRAGDRRRAHTGRAARNLRAAAPMRPPTPQGAAGHPRKKFYRARAHANPLSDGHFVDLPDCPGAMDWGGLYPEMRDAAEKEGARLAPPTVADVGCGFGGLLVQLSPLLPAECMVGIELRESVCDYVRQRAAVLRRSAPPRALNVAALRVNAQRHLTHLFAKGSLGKLFFLFPDPHFKAKNFRRRIVTPSLCADYAYLLKPDGRLYTVTDVPDLGAWMAASLDAHPLFRRMTESELAADPAVALLDTATEEGQKVARNGGGTWKACYVRLGEARAVGAA